MLDFDTEDSLQPKGGADSKSGFQVSRQESAILRGLVPRVSWVVRVDVGLRGI